MTRAKMQEKREDLEKQKKQIEDNYHAVIGALQLINQLIEEEGKQAVEDAEIVKEKDSE